MKQTFLALCATLFFCCLPATPLLAQSEVLTTVTMGPFSGLPTVAVAGSEVTFLVPVTNSGTVTARQPQVTQNLFAPFPNGA